jgi:predicted transcriptional regulator
MEQLHEAFSRLGFSPKESAMYLATLELGSAPVQILAKRAGVNRATAYGLLEALMNRGLVSRVSKGKKGEFASEHPERLCALLRLQQQTLKEQEEMVRELLPMLGAMQNQSGQKPKVRFLEGEEGVMTTREIFLRLMGPFVQIVPMHETEAHPLLRKAQAKHLCALHTRQIPHRAILLMDKPDLSRVPAISCGEVRVLPKEILPIKAEITVRANHIFLYTFSFHPIAVVIENQEIADAIGSLFELAWRGADGAPSRLVDKEADLVM